MYYKLDADIVLDAEMVLSSLDSTTAHTEPEPGNIIVIGNPSGRYIRQCLEKGETAFSIVDRQVGPPLLQLRGETLNDLSQGIVYFYQPFVIVNRHRSQVSCSHIRMGTLCHPQCSS